MPPATSADVDSLAAFFRDCGLSQVRSLETARGKTATAVQALFSENELAQKNLSEKQALLALQVSKDGAKLSNEKQTYVVSAIVDTRLKTADQVSAACTFMISSTFPPDTNIFNKACGVGYSATPEEIESRVRAFMLSNKDELAKTSWAGQGKAVGRMKLENSLRWAPPLVLKEAADKVYLETFGPKQDKAAAAGKGKAKETQPKTTAASATITPNTASGVEPSDEMFATGWLSRLHKPGENPQPIPERMKEHLKATSGQVFTRFPPEPNGFLHIGHSKAITVNFGYAKYHKGHCYLRFDDTNPEAEEQIYFDKILEAVRWLGFEPYKVTYSSDNFEKLYDLAISLIERGLAYTSNDTAEDIAIQRGGKDHGPRTESKDRSKPMKQSLEEFIAMKEGNFKPGEMTLRMKQDMSNPNPVMWDIIAYRVLSKPHHRTGSKWCIYPTYDFTHCLCDSFENISHSLCTTEFIGAREAYEWLCDALEVYRPKQSEYGRLNLEGSVMSKRKLLRLVKEGHVSGWDDPRLYTLVALKRRGIPPAAIISFVSALGVSTTSSTIPLNRFEQTVRQHLETKTPRLMMVLNPIRITFDNLPSDFHLAVEKPLHPKDISMGTNTVPFTSTIFIDADDFRDTPSKDFFRLAPGATVGLLNVPCPITYVSHEVDHDGKVKSIVCHYEDGASPPKPKTYIQWVAQHAASSSPVKIKETRIFKRLFKSDDPASLGDAYIQDIDPESLARVSCALIETGIWQVIKQSLAEAKKIVEDRKKAAEAAGTEAPPLVDGVEAIRFQGLRVAYFCLDTDSTLKELGGEKVGDGGDVLMLNQIAPLKQDAGKRA